MLFTWLPRKLKWKSERGGIHYKRVRERKKEREKEREREREKERGRDGSCLFVADSERDLFIVDVGVVLHGRHRGWELCESVTFFPSPLFLSQTSSLSLSLSSPFLHSPLPSPRRLTAPSSFFTLSFLSLFLSGTLLCNTFLVTQSLSLSLSL